MSYLGKNNFEQLDDVSYRFTGIGSWWCTGTSVRSLSVLTSSNVTSKGVQVVPNFEHEGPGHFREADYLRICVVGGWCHKYDVPFYFLGQAVDCYVTSEKEMKMPKPGVHCESLGYVPFHLCPTKDAFSNTWRALNITLYNENWTKCICIITMNKQVIFSW